MADVPLLLADAEAQLAGDAVTTAESMTLMDASVSEATTTWTGMELNIGSTVSSGIIAESSSIVATEMVTPARLSESASSLIDQMDTVLGFEPIGTQMSMSAAGEVSSVFSSLQSETEAAQLEATSKWTIGSALKLMGKIAMYAVGAAMVLDWLGTKLVSIIQVSIDATHPPPWAQSMSASEKKDLKAVIGAVPQLSLLIQGWHAQWKTFSTSFANSLGNIDATVGGRKVSVPALYVIYYAFSDMEGTLHNAKNAISGTNINLADLIQATDYLFIFLADALSMYQLKAKSAHLQAQNFPPDKDKLILDKIILTFPNGQARVQAVGVTYLRFVSNNAIKTFMHVQMIQEIYTELQNVVLPAMKLAAKDAFKTAAKGHMQKEKAAIQALAWVPGAGIALAKQKLAKEQGIATQLGTTAAKLAAENKMKEMLPLVKEKAKAIMKSKANTDQKQLHMIVNMAISDATGQAKNVAQSLKKP